MMKNSKFNKKLMKFKGEVFLRWGNKTSNCKKSKCRLATFTKPWRKFLSKVNTWKAHLELKELRESKIVKIKLKI
jgi:hypothetical protein